MLRQLKPQDRRLILLIAMVGIVAMLARLFIAPQTYYRLAEFSADGNWIELTEKALAQLEVPAQTRINPSASASASAIDLFIFDSQRMSALPADVRKSNCSYVGDGRTILCDVELIRSLVAHFDFNQREVTTSNEDGIIVNRRLEPEVDDEINRARLNLLTWVLSHELGHLLERHKGRFYFAEHGSAMDLDENNYCHRLEYEADSYAVTLLPEYGVEEFYLFNYELLNRELRGLACPDNPKVALCENVMAGTGLAITDDDIENLLSGTHPQTIVRVLRIGEVAQSRQDFGLFAYQLSQVIDTQLKTIGSPSWRCR